MRLPKGESAKSFGGGQHTFTVTVAVRAAGADWSTDLEPQQVQAYNIAEALELAGAVPFENWFPPEVAARIRSSPGDGTASA